MCQLPMRVHIVQHHISARQTVFRIYFGIISGGCLEQTHQNRSLFGCQILGSCLKICLCSRLDAKRIAAEIDSIKIECQDILLAIHVFYLDCCNPLFRLHHQQTKSWHFSQQSCGILRTYLEEILHQLLCDSAGTARISLNNILEC